MAYLSGIPITTKAPVLKKKIQEQPERVQKPNSSTENLFPMTYPLPTYLARFTTLRPKLLASLNPKKGQIPHITHRWSSDGYSSSFWEEGDLPKKQPRHNHACEWFPNFTVRTPDYCLTGRLDDDGHAPYWVFDLTIPQKTQLHSRTGFRGPYKMICIYDLLEDDLPNLSSFLLS
jgi:hypothetical protein